MAFHSILFDRPEDRGLENQREPECFHDLNLDQVVASVTAGREAYGLGPFFRTPLRRVEAIHYRHEVFRDLEEAAISMPIASFAEAMSTVRARLIRSEQAYYALQRRGWFLEAVNQYCVAVAELSGKLGEARPHSSGLIGFGDYLGTYLLSRRFLSMREEAQRLATELAAIEYDLYIEGARIEVRAHEGAADYGAEVSRTFAKFAQGATRGHRFRIHDSPEMNHVEAAILDRVALLFPQPFSDLAAFWESYHRDALDAVIRRFDREVQFYLAYREQVVLLRAVGLEFCYPEMSERTGDVRAEAIFDLALAGKLSSSARPAAERKSVVANDFHLDGAERVLVVSGANQGGKTTFARAFGQLHYLAALGCPAPARAARVLLFDELYTHFEREESPESLLGKLEEELLRLRQILKTSTPRSVLIMNETFGSTTLEDARFLGRSVLKQVIAKDMLCVWVTFLEELASLDASTVSMVAGVDPNDPAVRTFRIVRRPADGLAYAVAIARKYHLTEEDVRARIARASTPSSTATRIARGSEAAGSPLS